MCEERIYSHTLRWKYASFSLKSLFKQVSKTCFPNFYFQSKDSSKELVCFFKERQVFLKEVDFFSNFLEDSVFFVGLLAFDGAEAELFVPQFVIERDNTQLSAKIFTKKVSNDHFESLCNKFEDYMKLFLSGISQDTDLSKEIILGKKNAINPSCLIHWKGPVIWGTQSKNFTEDFLKQEKNWTNIFVKAKENLEKGFLEKVVLACCREGYISNHTNRSLLVFDSFFCNSINTYQMCFYPDLSKIIFSASPETLCRIENNNIYTESLAGSSLVSEGIFLQKPKIQKENEIVTVFIQKVLSKYCTDIQKSALHSIFLQYIQHARCTITGRLVQGVNYWDLIRDLHPTPAVCGSPRKLAQDFIQTYESFPRNWYAGIGGVFYKNSCDTFVNIRTIYIQNNFVRQYAGVGITIDSIQEEEIEELSQKFQHWSG